MSSEKLRCFIAIGVRLRNRCTDSNYFLINFLCGQQILNKYFIATELSLLDQIYIQRLVCLSCMTHCM